jgi:hypothetical protein
MSTLSPHPAPTSHTSWGIALAAGSLLLIGGGTLVWSVRDAGDPARAPLPPDRPALALAEAPIVPDQSTARRPLPPRPEFTLQSVAYTTENGVRVVKIKVVDSGDELVVDAATGRLLEARPSRPTAPPPVGKFAAPFDPMT